MQQNDPFFSSDVEGVTRFVIMVFGFLSTLFVAIWKLLTKPINERISRIDTLLTGKDNKSRLDMIEGEALLMRNDIKGLTESFDRQQEILEEVVDCNRSLDKTMSILSERLEGKIDLMLERSKHRRKGDEI